MDVIFLGAGRPSRGELPSALKPLALRTRALDWQLNSLASLRDLGRIQFLGGYGVEDVVRHYPELDFVLVPDWETHGILHSLLRASLSDAPLLIAYSDTVFRPAALAGLIATDTDVALGFDSAWRDRYPSRPADDMQRAETIAVDLPDGRRLEAEFTGLLHLSAAAAAYLKTIDEKAVGETLVDLVATLKSAGFSIAPVDLKGQWAEFNDPKDVARFILGTKADTLARLRDRVALSTIGAQTTFAVGSWRRDRHAILTEVARNFQASARLIVRSSMAEEDGWAGSRAGCFTSVQNVDARDEQAIASAIEQVIESYGTTSESSQVLVQSQVENVLCAGVVLTCGLDTGSPYYRLNLDDQSQATTVVTAGAQGELRTLIVRRERPEQLSRLEPSLAPVLAAVREIEDLLAFDRLDVEFAVDEAGSIHLFQVRPITVDHSSFEHDPIRLADELDANAARFDRLQAAAPNIVGARTVFGNMPDWNPAEILGARARPLALSLYERLVTDDVWAAQRAEFGYRDVRPHRLLASFSGQPYVDVRASLNSFIPSDVSEDSAGRIVDAYLGLLIDNPGLHDKLEFDVAFTIWYPGFREVARHRLGERGATEADLDALEAGLKRITRDALTRLPSDLALLTELDDRRQRIETSALAPLDRIVALIEDCARLGTPSFAHAARAGFVASTLLARLVASGSLSRDRRQAFMASLDTVARQFRADRAALAAGVISAELMVERYGHLRPGSYEIAARAYWEDPASYLASRGTEEIWTDAPFQFEIGEKQAISSLLAALDAPLTADAFTAFLRDALEARESAKFRFTRNLSRALDLCVALAPSLDMSRDDLSFVRYSDFVLLRSGGMGAAELRAAAARNRESYRYTQLAELPSLILDRLDFHGFEQPASQPNFVTTRCVRGRLHPIEGLEGPIPPGAIILAQRADPGYDWLLDQGISGLITRYGGANSHMAIRSAELGLAAAIGVGDKYYERIAAMTAVELDCGNRVIRELS